MRGVAEEIFGRSFRKNFISCRSYGTCCFGVFPVGLRRAAILSIDGIGETAGSELAKAEGERIQAIEIFDYPNSLGFLWEGFSSYLGFSSYDASKLMGLAAYGNPEVYRRQFQSILRVGREDYAADPELIGFRTDFAKLESLVGPPRYPDFEFEPRHADIAAALQETTNAAVMALVRRIKRKVPFEISALPAASRSTVRPTSFSGNRASSPTYPSRRRRTMTVPRSAPPRPCTAPNRKNLRSAATPRHISDPRSTGAKSCPRSSSAGLTARQSKAPAREAADMIAAGKIVAWFQGRMEFGPRALGNRSLLPTRAGATCATSEIRRSRLQDFRPLRRASGRTRRRWFEVCTYLVNDEFMLFAPNVKNGSAIDPAVVHQDGSPGCNSSAANQIRALTTGCLVSMRKPACAVVNTTFNDSEPIVRTPTDVIVTFRKSALTRWSWTMWF